MKTVFRTWPTTQPRFVLLSNTFPGYLLRWLLEFVPLGLWAVGDILGLITGLLDFIGGHRLQGSLKILVAVIPGVPTIPLQFIIDKLFNLRPQPTPSPKIGTPGDPEIGVILNP